MNITVNGPQILWVLFPDSLHITITQTTLTSWIVMAILITAAFFINRNLSVRKPGKVQVLVEKGVSMMYDMVESIMGSHNSHFTPYIGTLFLSSILGTLLGMTGVLRSATADLSTTVAWALATSLMQWHGTIKNDGIGAFLKNWINPMNLISDVAQPISMSFRHFGNIAGGSVLTTLIYSGLAVLSSFVLQWVPVAAIKVIPIFQLGIPAFLSIYFDLFSGFVQALIFIMLTMVFVGGSHPAPEEK